MLTQKFDQVPDWPFYLVDVDDYSNQTGQKPIPDFDRDRANLKPGSGVHMVIGRQGSSEAEGYWADIVEALPGYGYLVVAPDRAFAFPIKEGDRFRIRYRNINDFEEVE